MVMHEMMRLKNQFTEKGILICFNGPFLHSIIEELGLAVRRHLENEEIKKDAMMDVFAVYIELTQNVKNYLTKKQFPPKEFNIATIIIAKQNGKYTISSGNIIKKYDATELVEKIERLNALDKDGLKRLYREQIRREVPPDATGAGVGLIDIARRSSRKLKYLLNEINDNYNFFVLTAEV
jgi:hypothetical protein